MANENLPARLPSNAVEVLQKSGLQKQFFGGGMPPVINVQMNIAGGTQGMMTGVGEMLQRLDTLIQLAIDRNESLRQLIGSVGSVQPGGPGQPPKQPGTPAMSGIGRLTNFLGAVGAGGGSTGGTAMSLLMNSGRTNPVAALAVAATQAATALVQVGQVSQRTAFELGQFSPAMRSVQMSSQFRGINRSFREGNALAPDAMKLTGAVENLKDTVAMAARPLRQLEMQIETAVAKALDDFLKALMEVFGIKTQPIDDIASDRLLQYIIGHFDEGDRKDFLNQAIANMRDAKSEALSGGLGDLGRGWAMLAKEGPAALGRAMAQPGQKFWKDMDLDLAKIAQALGIGPLPPQGQRGWRF